MSDGVVCMSALAERIRVARLDAGSEGNTAVDEGAETEGPLALALVVKRRAGGGGGGAFLADGLRCGKAGGCLAKA